MSVSTKPRKAGTRLPLYRHSIAGTLLAAREAVMSPIRPRLREADLTEQQWRVLRVLDGEGATDPSRLASSALLYPPSVTRILRELLKRDLIQRAPDPTDGRRSVVAISARGAALVRSTSQETLKMLHLYSDLFGKARIEALLSELRAFTDAISGGARPAGTEED